MLKSNCIVVVTPGFPADENDTTCLPAFQQFAISLKRNFPEFKFIVVTLHYPFKKSDYTWNGIDVYSMGGKNKKALFILKTKRLMLQTLNKLHSNYTIKGIISLWCTDAAMVANKFSVENKLKNLVWIIGQDAKETNGFVKKIKPDPKQLIAMSDFLKHSFEKNHNIVPMHIITNGINESTFESLNTGERPIDIFGAGSLIPLKNYGLFIGVIEEVVKHIPTLVVKIAGNGIEKENLIRFIKEKKLDKTIEILGSKSHSETLKLMNQSKVFLHTSHYEGNSTVLMEALYSGCQVISTRELSNNPVKNLVIKNNLKEIVNHTIHVLSQNSVAERIIFNTMDNSAKKMMELLLV